MKTPHPHADLLRAIADGEPLDNFEVKAKFDDAVFGPGMHTLRLGELCNWIVRRKPRTIRIGDVEVVAGITEAPKYHTTVFVADPTQINCHFSGRYYDITLWTNRLNCGLVHLTKEPAVAMGRALAAMTEHKE